MQHRCGYGPRIFYPGPVFILDGEKIRIIKLIMLYLISLYVKMRGYN
ncbi:hypothetical protein CLOSTASPAR_00853 [[Clostridium] asparagiforme DSM 15981]|uniref:Uncharacterized protein n=1 Tax=[Clostridium] asparagiforme DSM 15981 TaxID=518636 RepID=C0CV52_9FIRM|nr:hypothetical protein CLOSTASPAR_00853 [[Clostridium] asparagiforme DSM 15981]